MKLEIGPLTRIPKKVLLILWWLSIILCLCVVVYAQSKKHDFLFSIFHSVDVGLENPRTGDAPHGASWGGWIQNLSNQSTFKRLLRLHSYICLKLIWDCPRMSFARVIPQLFWSCWLNWSFERRLCSSKGNNLLFYAFMDVLLRVLSTIVKKHGNVLF